MTMMVRAIVASFVVLAVERPVDSLLPKKSVYVKTAPR